MEEMKIKLSINCQKIEEKQNRIKFDKNEKQSLRQSPVKYFIDIEEK